MFKQLIYIAALFLFFVSCDLSSWTETPKIDDAKNQKNIWTEQEKASATQHCIVSGNAKEFCECSVTVLTSLFSYQEFQSFNEQIKSGIQPTPNIVSKMIEMSKRVGEQCKKE